MATFTSTDNLSWSTPVFATSPTLLFRSPTSKNVVSYLIPEEIDTTMKISNTISSDMGSPEVIGTGITPGWWSEELTAEDIEISLMPREAVLAEILEMAGSWADRPDSIAAIEEAREAWGKKISDLYDEENHPS